MFPQRSVIIQFARIIVLAAATLAILGACSSTESARTAPATIAKSAVTLTAKDIGRSITLAIGQELIVRDGAIAKVFYPVFPPDKNADDVIGWLAANRG